MRPVRRYGPAIWISLAFWLVVSCCLAYVLFATRTLRGAPAPLPKRHAETLISPNELFGTRWNKEGTFNEIAHFRSDGRWETYYDLTGSQTSWLGTWRLENDWLYVEEGCGDRAASLCWEVKLRRDGTGFVGEGFFTRWDSNLSRQTYQMTMKRPRN